jgi:hypothetical protein
MLGNRDDPVKSGRRDRRVKVVYLVCGDSLALEERESYMSKGAVLGGPGGPRFALHNSVIGCRSAKGDSISPVIRAHSRKGAAAGHPSFEMVNVDGSRLGPAG